IGSELCRQIAKFNPSLLLLLDQDETGIFNISEELKNKFPRLKISSVIADIQDEEKMDKVFNELHPNIVFHAAAYKHVPLMEENPDEAIKNNIFGTNIVAKSALKSGAEKFIFISTDKAVNPTSVMGATKRLGEMICQMLNQKNNTKFISVRFGNVLDSRGSVIPIFREQIKRRGPVEVTHPEMKRYFMLISEACLLVMQAGAIGRGGEVFVLDMGKPIKILDLAKEMIRFSGFEPDKDIPIVFTEPRPGEKLFEEILTAEEGIITTENQKIFRAKLSVVDEKKLNEGLEKLKNEVQKAEKKEIINTLKQLILDPHTLGVDKES
ncbi:MAG: polysaccharide biosynthesis protein, partial [bacterium]|nr:polysaccharide biosynthesis protein [bacterium]